MHAAGNIFVKTYLKAIRDTFFPICGISQYVIFLSNRRRKCKLLGLQGDPPPQFSRLVGHPDLPMRKTLRLVGHLTVMILFQIKKFTECKIIDEKVETFFCFFDSVQSTEDYTSI